jgi:hypothetical protein
MSTDINPRTVTEEEARRREARGWTRGQFFGVGMGVIITRLWPSITAWFRGLGEPQP